jgi:hypothetical protein
LAAVRILGRRGALLPAQLHAPKAIINLSGLPAGAYILTEWREAELLGTHKVIVQP